MKNAAAIASLSLIAVLAHGPPRARGRQRGDDDLFLVLPCLLLGLAVGAALVGPAMGVGILASLTNPLFHWAD